MNSLNKNLRLPYGECSTYDQCNNLYGSCFGEGAPISECLLVCYYTGHWVYCNGLGGGSDDGDGPDPNEKPTSS